MSLEALEKQIKEKEDDLKKKMESIARLDTQYEQSNNQLLYLNSQIEGLENQLKLRKIESDQRKKELLEQDMQVLRKGQEQADVRMRKTFQNFFQSEKSKMQLQANKQNIKMDVNSVAIFLMENPHDYVTQQWLNEENDALGEFSIPYKCATFLIKKNTTLGQLFDQGCYHWGLSKNQYTMSDGCFNILDMLEPYYAENFFSAHKETNPQAYMFMYKKNIYTNFLFDQQKNSIKIPGKEVSNQNTGNQDFIINQEMEDFTEVVPGMKLYQGQVQEEKPKTTGSVSIGWKIILLIMSATYLILLFLNATNHYDYLTASEFRYTIFNYIFGEKEADTVEDLYEKLKFLTITDRDNETEIDTIRFQFIQMSGLLKMFQVRTSLYDCSTIETAANETICRYAIYSDLNANTEDIVATDGQVYDWGKYQDSDVTTIEGFVGILSSYDGAVYESDYNAYEYVNDIIEEQKGQGLIDKESTKLFGITFVIYDDSRRMFYVVYYYVEISPSYELIEQGRILPFKVNSLNTTDPRLLSINTIEYVKLSLCGLLSLILMFIEYRETKNRILLKKKKISLKDDFFEFMQVNFLYNLLILVLQITSFLLMYGGPQDNIDIFNDKFPNLMEQAYQYRTSMLMQGMLIILVGFNTLKLFQISESVALMQAMAAKGAESISLIILFAFMILAAFAYWFFQIMNQRSSSFSTYFKSFLSTLSMFLLGNFNLWENAANVEPSTTLILTVFIFMLFSYGTTVLLNAVLQEVYRTISYRTDHLQVIYEFYAKIDEIKNHITHYFEKFKNQVERTIN